MAGAARHEREDFLIVAEEVPANEFQPILEDSAEWMTHAWRARKDNFVEWIECGSRGSFIE